MPTRAKMTIISLYNYDNTLFDNLTVPAGDPDNGIPAVNKSVAIGRILIECAPFELMYPDLDFMKYAIANFSEVNSHKWEKLLKTEYLDYNPIYNVDADETETITRQLSGTDNNSRTLNSNENGENTNQYAGFNSSSLRDISGNTENNNVKGSVNDAGENTEKETITNTKTRKGNIGVTMTQQMIEEERKVSDFSIYKTIAEDFKKSFCCLVY